MSEPTREKPVTAAGSASDWQVRIDKLGTTVVEVFHILGLFIIGGTIVWSAAHTYLDMIYAGRASLQDILLLFIYLELGAMVGVYFHTKRVPVRFLLYIAITALTRVLTIDVKEMEWEHMLATTFAILIVTAAVLILQYAARMSSGDADCI